MSKQASLSATMEDYLEAILQLARDGTGARVRDIARTVGVTLSTVSGTLRRLKRMGMVNYQPYEIVTLTPAGFDAAERTSKRHQLLSGFLKRVLGVSDEAADTDACRLEHGLSRETVDSLVAFMEFLEGCARAGPDLVQRFQARCTNKLKPESCRACIADWLPKAQARLSEPAERLGKGTRQSRGALARTGSVR